MPPQHSPEQAPLVAPLNQVVPKTPTRTLPLILAGAAVVAAVVGMIWWLAPAAQQSVSVEPKKIGMAYFPQGGDYANFDYAENLDGPSVQALGPVAKKLKIWLIVPIFEKRAQILAIQSSTLRWSWCRVQPCLMR